MEDNTTTLSFTSSCVINVKTLLKYTMLKMYQIIMYLNCVETRGMPLLTKKILDYMNRSDINAFYHPDYNYFEQCKLYCCFQGEI